MPLVPTHLSPPGAQAFSAAAADTLLVQSIPKGGRFWAFMVCNDPSVQYVSGKITSTLRAPWAAAQLVTELSD